MSLKISNPPSKDALPEGVRRRHLLAQMILAAMTLACLCPFLGKAFHIDDPLFIWCARHLRADPWNFYDFKVNWYGREEAMSAATQNPPLAAYYLALVGWLLGWTEVALHSGFLFPAVAAVLGTYRLATRFCGHPFAAGLAAIAAPVFLVSGTSVMCDTMMLAFWVWALVFWLEGLAKNSPASLGVAALLIAACGLTKYFGFALVPLAFVYAGMERRKFGAWLAYLLFPVMILVLYEWLTRKLYGKGAVAEAFAYAGNQRTAGDLPWKMLAGLAFSGGSFIILLPSTLLLWDKRAWVAALIALVVAGISLAALKPVGHAAIAETGHTHWLFLIQLLLLAGSGFSLLALATADLLQNRSAAALLLFLWVFGTFVFACVVSWQISGRYLLPMLPAVSILLLRRLERRGLLPGRNQIGPLAAPVGISLLIALLVTRADYQLANSARAAAAHIQRETRAQGHTVWFEGHWGFQYYLELQGARPVDFRHFQYSSDDVIILPLGNSFVFNPPPADLAPWFEYDAEMPPFLTTMSASCGAGFYSDDWGPLPFVFCRSPAQRYLIFRAK